MANDSLSDAIYKHFKTDHYKKYDEEKHCKMLINCMLDKNKGTVTAFCAEAKIEESTFYAWVNQYPIFERIYYYGKVVSREAWEEEGRALRDMEIPMGTINHAFEYWKMIGWTRFGISKNSRIKLKVASQDSPAAHYRALLKQASEGDFTAAEFKQLMEAVNVGLNVQQVYELQKQIDELKSDLLIVTANKDVENPFTNKGTA